jgi:hypothetical protein
MKNIKLFIACVILVVSTKGIAQAPPPPPGLMWTGHSSTDWNNPDNWTGGVPSSTQTVIIPSPSPNYPIVSSSTVAVRNLLINPGASLTVASGAAIDIYGAWANYGNSSIGTGAVNLRDASGSTISGYTAFNELNIYGTYTIGSNRADRIDITGALHKYAGCIITNNKLTLTSTAQQTAMIVDHGGALRGKIYAERYITGYKGYHYISSPVETSIMDVTGISTTGNNGDVAIMPDNGGGVITYREAANNTAAMNIGYYNYTAPGNKMFYGQGYGVMIKAIPATIKFFGEPHMDNHMVSITKLGTNAATAGWNLVGNPYPGAISWSALKAANGSTVSGTCYLWKTTGANRGVWQAYNGTVGINGAGDLISSGQGFYVVKANAGTSNLSFPTAIRSTMLTPAFFKNEETAPNEIRLTISSLDGDVSEALAYTEAGTTAGFDAETDAILPVSPEGMQSTAIAFRAQSTDCMIQAIDALTEQSELPLTIHAAAAGQYTISAAALNVTNLPVYLLDKYNNIYHDLSVENVTITTQGSGDITDRYSIVFTKKATASLKGENDINIFTRTNAIVIDRTPSDAQATVRITDLLGREVLVSSMPDYHMELPVSAEQGPLYLVYVKEMGRDFVSKKVYVPSN